MIYGRFPAGNSNFIQVRARVIEFAIRRASSLDKTCRGFKDSESKCHTSSCFLSMKLRVISRIHTVKIKARAILPRTSNFIRKSLAWRRLPVNVSCTSIRHETDNISAGSTSVCKSLRSMQNCPCLANS